MSVGTMTTVGGGGGGEEGDFAQTVTDISYVEVKILSFPGLQLEPSSYI